jgi:hypothetical protein
MARIAGARAMTDIAQSIANTWREHVKLISEAWQKGVGSIVETGQRLIEAKNELEHGQFETMIENKLPFTPSTAQRLMKIAANPILAKPAHAQALPPSWGTLYELTKLPERKLVAKLEDGTINPKSARKDIIKLLPPPKRRTKAGTASECEFGPRAEALPTRVKVYDDAGHLRLATPDEAKTVFAVANAIANPIINAWERADEVQRTDFVRLFRDELVERFPKANPPPTRPRAGRHKKCSRVDVNSKDEDRTEDDVSLLNDDGEHAVIDHSRPPEVRIRAFLFRSYEAVRAAQMDNMRGLVNPEILQVTENAARAWSDLLRDMKEAPVADAAVNLKSELRARERA